MNDAQNIVLFEAPFTGAFVSEFVQAVRTIFGDAADQSWLDSLKWRLEKMPDVTVFAIQKGSRIVAFKAGYAVAYDRYYSWLGGVDPDFRKQGIAEKLMIAQHGWLVPSRFKSLETHVEQDNEAMIHLNLKSGFVVAGTFEKNAVPNFIMQKHLKIE